MCEELPRNRQPLPLRHCAATCPHSIHQTGSCVVYGTSPATPPRAACLCLIVIIHCTFLDLYLSASLQGDRSAFRQPTDVGSSCCRCTERYLLKRRLRSYWRHPPYIQLTFTVHCHTATSQVQHVPGASTTASVPQLCGPAVPVLRYPEHL